MEQLTADDPQWIGQYRLLRRLGSGGMGRVYLGRTAGGRTVAVKRVHADLASDSEFRARFRQEVEAARRVGGRWTAPVFDADTEGPYPWVATGYVAGPSLQAAVREFGPLPPASVRALGAGLAEALAAVHGLGLVHRDVKPSNVLLALDGPRLIDFGITRALDAAVQLTRTGLLVGSPGYLSPEQARGTVAGPASDVFSLGAVLAFAAAGTPPFGEGQQAATLLYRVLHESPDLGRLDPGLRSLVAACMAKDPAERPTPDQLRAGLGADGKTVQLGAAGWLPPAISASVGRLAVELLDLDAEPRDVAAPTLPQPAPAAAATMTGAALPSSSTVPPPATARRRGPLIALSAAGVVAVAAVAIAISVSSSSGTPSASSSTPSGIATSSGVPSSGAPSSIASSSTATSSSTTPTSTAGSTTTPVSTAPSGAIPSEYLGKWQGTISGGSLPKPLAIEVDIAQGHPGDQVGVITNDSGEGYSCQIDTALVSATSTRVVMRDIPSTVTNGCVPIIADQYYTLKPDGTMQLKLSTYQAQLTRR